LLYPLEIKCKDKYDEQAAKHQQKSNWQANSKFEWLVHREHDDVLQQQLKIESTSSWLISKNLTKHVDHPRIYSGQQGECEKLYLLTTIFNLLIM
jgi:uncharacterized protein with NAD-binding domain and iron-sulfur cluster